jgi:adenosylmethionine-8-amino-7-oxononanoate aminotransferase
MQGSEARKKTAATGNGGRGAHVIAAPPYIVTEPNSMEIVDQLYEAVDSVFA